MDDQPPDVATDEFRAEMYERFGWRDGLLKAIGKHLDRLM